MLRNEFRSPAAVNSVGKSSPVALNCVGMNTLSLARRPAPAALTLDDDAETNAFACSPAHMASPMLISSSGRSLTTPTSLAGPSPTSSASPSLARTESAPSGGTWAESRPGTRPASSAMTSLFSPAAKKGGEAVLSGQASYARWAQHQGNGKTPTSRGTLSLGKPGAALPPHAAAMIRRRVTFCPTPSNTTHNNFTPYGTIYGKHPGLFNFDRKGDMQLNDAGIAEEMNRKREMYLLPSPD